MIYYYSKMNRLARRKFHMIVSADVAYLKAK